MLALAGASLGASIAPALRQDPVARGASLPKLLQLRGGVQPSTVKTTALVEKPAATLHGAAQLRKALKNKPIAPRRKQRASFDLQDAFTTALCLSAMGAAALSNAPLIAGVPKHMKDYAWLAFGSALSTILLLLVRVFNYDRAMAVNRGLGKLVLGTSTPVAAPSSLPSFAVASVVGAVASFQSLPSSAG